MADVSNVAPEGSIWVCRACGRHGRDRYKLGDSSCVTWAILCAESSLVFEGGQLIRAEALFEEEWRRC